MFTIKRIETNDNGTFGAMSCDGQPFALTLEPPWRDNKKNISCIPHGRYVCKRVRSPKFGNTFEITGVQERSHILFHKGNTKRASKGCVLIGEEFGLLNGVPAILSSSRGYDEFMGMLRGEKTFVLEIHNYF